MHIKISSKFKSKNNKGYVLLESIVILMLVACICMMLNKVVINNYLKSTVVYTRDDIKTLSGFEENALLDAMNAFNNNLSKNEFSNRYNGELITINIKNKPATLMKKDGSGRKCFINLNYEDITVGENRVVNLSPKTYKTTYMVMP